MWISTLNGISKFDPDTKVFTNYDAGDGLSDNIFQEGAAFKSDSGELFFGGQEGVTAFFPDQIKNNPYVPPVVMTSLSISYEEVSVGGASPLPTPISIAEEIVLSYDDRDISLSFAALSFHRPEKNLYAYKLEGYEDTWHSPGTDRRATYTNLNPGDYIFRVKASNNDGIWNEEGTSLRITILPPWWKATWAYALYTLLLLGAAVGTYLVQHARIVRNEREKAQLRESELRAEAAELQARALQAENERKQVELEKAHELETAYCQLEEQKTKIEALARKLTELDRMKTRFFANISHEFRTPLTLILGPLRDALDEAFGPVDERLQQQMGIMQRNGRRLLRLINQLLDLSRLESGNLTLRARQTNLIPFLRSIVSMFASQAERKNIQLQFASTEEERYLYFEPDKLEKVVSNLISNALKFTPAHGKIHVSEEPGTEETGAFVEITVKDTGEGIPAEELPYIFDRFHQVDASSVREHEGSGIGLALAKELVELHGGKIRAESEPDFGTTFIVRLLQGTNHLDPGDIVEEAPVEAVREGVTPEAVRREAAILTVEESSRMEANEETAYPVSRVAPIILVAEDNADMREYLRSHLAPRYRVAEAVDGIEGLEIIREVDPALVICDVMMPRMNGYAFCETVKADEGLNHIPVVLLTARASEESKVEGLKTGADDYIYKPFSAEELLARVENLIELRRRLRKRFSDEVIVGPSEISVSSADAELLDRVRETVEQHMSDSNFSTEWLADEVGMSQRNLRRKIQAMTNLSLSGYVRMMRLERAVQLLEQRTGTVSEIAYQVGFKNPAHFSALFNQVFGVSPSRYADERK